MDKIKKTRIKSASTILTSFTFTKFTTFLSSIKTLTIFFLTFCFSAFTSFFNLSQLNSKLESGLQLLCNFIESFWISCKGIQNSFSMFFIWLLITTTYAVTVLIAENLKVKTFAIHFKAFWLFTITSQLLYFLYLKLFLTFLFFLINVHSSKISEIELFLRR